MSVIRQPKGPVISRTAKHHGWGDALRRNGMLSAWPFVVVILTQMAIGVFSVYTLSATRTLVAGESLWSKGQHEAVYFLSLYLDTGDKQYLQDFKRTIAVPLAYRRGRDALESHPPRPDITRRAFEDGGTAQQDIPAVIWMFKNFRGFPYLEDAIARWKETDPMILELQRMGDSLGAGDLPADKVELRNRVEAIDSAITPRTIKFSRALDDGARVVERILLLANFTLAALLAVLTIWRVGKVMDLRRRSEEALAWQASHDELTGLANRRAFEHRLLLMSHPNKAKVQSPYALFYLDLDQFKIVNDTCGHAAGDALLRDICAPLQQLLGPNDLFARIGGDEFSILAPGLGLTDSLKQAEKVRAVVEKIVFMWNGRKFGVTVSIGVVHHASGPVVPEAMMTKADMACFMAKEKGRNRVHAHRDGDQEVLGRIHEMNWIQRIQQALDEDRFCLYAQEIVALTNPEDDGVHLEVLVRMRDEAGALVPPSSFIPAAERFGVMKLIDRRVVTRTFQTLAERRLLKNKTPISCCAINLSGETFGDAGFLDFLKQVFAEYKISPDTICFEVTETTAIRDLQAARSFVRDLRAIGCTFALDDFGTGMSSFSYLKELPVDYLKIDGSFVKNLLKDRPDRAMVEMISHVGHIMGKRIVAEFVESEELADALRDIGVDYGQGYGLAPPKPFDARFDDSASALRPACERHERRLA